MTHNWGVGWFKKIRAKAQVERDAASVDVALLAHLREFIATRRGIEAWVELPTGFNQASILLIAHDGEWTRRAMPSVGYAHQFAIDHGLPSYDAGVVPYPKRMRDYNARNRPPRPGVG